MYMLKHSLTEFEYIIFPFYGWFNMYESYKVCLIKHTDLDLQVLVFDDSTIRVKLITYWEYSSVKVCSFSIYWLFSVYILSFYNNTTYEDTKGRDS